ncbi:MAG: hypothetical protein IT539_17330 [Bradyrhizobiaceae bacterium]|nr:hypothetical protein [Bradyrhizobiaceae bacterium]
MTQQYQVRFLQIPRWLAIVAGALSVAFAIALFLLSLTVFLLVLPVIAVAGALYYFFGLPRAARKAQREAEARIIEGEYRVVQSERIERDR